MLAKSNGDSWSMQDSVRFVLRESPIIALIIVLIWRFPMIEGQIRRGYEANARQLDQVARATLEMAKLYQDGSNQRFALVEQLIKQLEIDAREHHKFVRDRMADIAEQFELLEDRISGMPSSPER